MSEDKNPNNYIKYRFLNPMFIIIPGVNTSFGFLRQPLEGGTVPIISFAETAMVILHHMSTPKFVSVTATLISYT